MGLTTLPKVGAGEALGVVKQDRPLELIPDNRKIKATEWNAAAVALEGVCAEIGLTDGSTPGSLVERVLTLETLPTGGDVTGPAGATSGNIPTLDATGKILADSGTSITDLTTATSTAQATATDALHPLVQTAHTSATKTLAAGDAGDIIPLDAASNAIEVTIPHTLFAAGGTGRAWVCQAKVVSVAGGAVTFVGSGGITIDYHGKDPGTDAYIAGDWLTIVVDSATTASVFASEAL